MTVEPNNRHSNEEEEEIGVDCTQTTKSQNQKTQNQKEISKDELKRKVCQGFFGPIVFHCSFCVMYMHKGNKRCQNNVRWMLHVHCTPVFVLFRITRTNKFKTINFATISNHELVQWNPDNINYDHILKSLPVQSFITPPSLWPLKPIMFSFQLPISYTLILII